MAIKKPLFSAKNKGQSTQADPDQYNITGAVHKIRISHKSDAAEKHYQLLALFPIGKITKSNDAENDHRNNTALCVTARKAF